MSIIIPVYNHATYLKTALKSIQRQTYSKIEVIAVDDASTDQSHEALQAIAEADKRIIVLKNDQNSGIVASLNRGIMRAKGDIIARMDADDISHSDRIYQQLNYLIENNYDLVGSKVRYLTEDGTIIGLSKHLTDNEIVRQLRFRSTIGHPTWLLKRELYKKLGGYRDVAPAEDYDFLCRAAKVGAKLSMLDAPLLDFRTKQHAGGTALSMGLVQRKMFNYVHRMNFSNARYSESVINRIRNSSSCSKARFTISQRILMLGHKKRHQGRYLYATLLTAVASVISFYQLQFIIRALVSKFTVFSKEK